MTMMIILDHSMGCQQSSCGSRHACNAHLVKTQGSTQFMSLESEVHASHHFRLSMR